VSVANGPQIREERKQDLEKHLAEVDAILKRQADDFDDEDAGVDEDGKTEEEWQGFEEPSRVDGTDEYVDEDKYTTVTIKEMGDADEWDASGDEDAKATTNTKDGVERNEDGTEVKNKRVWTKERPKNNKPRRRSPNSSTRARRKGKRQGQSRRRRMPSLRSSVKENKIPLFNIKNVQYFNQKNLSQTVTMEV